MSESSQEYVILCDPATPLAIHDTRACDLRTVTLETFSWRAAASVAALATAVVAGGVWAFGWQWLAFWAPIWVLCMLVGAMAGSVRGGA